MTINILKRDEALQPFSRDHGVLLVLAQKLSKAAGASDHKMMLTNEEIQNELAPLTLQYLADETAALNQSCLTVVLRRKIARDHEKILNLLEKLYTTSDLDKLRKLYATLADVIQMHIQWDEHVLFPYMQETMDSAKFSALCDKAQKMELARRRPTQRLHKSVKLD